MGIKSRTKRISLEALITEREGMNAENEWRLRRGEAPAYGIEHYRELASRIDELNKEDEGSITRMVSWLDSAPFLMGKLTEEDWEIREKIISILMKQI